MYRYVCSLLFITAFCLVNTAYSQSTVKVAVLPFEVYSQEKFTNLRTEIQAQIASQLKNEGAIVFAEDALFESEVLEKAKTAEEIRQTGVELGADYIIWGSITFIGKKFSIDARLAETTDKTMPIPFFAEGEGINNINENIKKLSNNLGNIIFKREKIVEIRLEGNKRIEDDAILRVIKTKPGDVYRSENLSEDLRLAYSMGYFEDIRIEFEEGPKGRIIIFKLKEKPTLRKILVEGNIGIDDEDIKSALEIKTGAILNNSMIAKSIKIIENLYIEKNVHHTKVTHNIKPLGNNQSDLVFVIEEGITIRIKTIDFEGNNAYTDKKLKKMFETKEKGFLSWLTSSGELNIEQLNHDISKLTVFYRNNGFIESRVGEPDIKYEDEWIYIKIKIQEGLQFKVGEINITGDLLKSKEDLIEGLKIKNEEFLNQEILRNDVLSLTDLYSDYGYYYADIFPRVEKDADKKIANITFVVSKGKLVYFDEIIISGNTKTRDKVIRRELDIYEQELYSGRKMKEGIRNLHRLNYFEDIKVNPIKGESDDKMTLKVEVTEKPTGAFTFGAGYSSGTGPFTTFSVSQNNLFGLGQVLQAKADLGRESNQYNLSFTEPWLFDIPLSAGVNLYNLKVRYDTYDVDSMGGGLRFSYPVFELTRASFSLAYKQSDINDVYLNAPLSIHEMKGSNDTISISTGIKYDSRFPNRMNPREGSHHSANIIYAGGMLGGDVGYTKYLAETGWYFPTFWNNVFFVHAKTGYVDQNSDGKLPDFERFYLGGIHSIRGFGHRDISKSYWGPVIDTDGDGDQDGDDTQYYIEKGGNKFVQFNAEVLVPLFGENSGIVGVVFFDTGNVFDDNENMSFGKFRESAGFGFRWFSPVGPIRLENGYILDPRGGESNSGKWEFSLGGTF